MGGPALRNWTGFAWPCRMPVGIVRSMQNCQLPIFDVMMPRSLHIAAQSDDSYRSIHRTGATRCQRELEMSELPPASARTHISRG